MVALPSRYEEDWLAPFDLAVQACLSPGARILDVGSGRTPTLNHAMRPPGARYVGLDISEAELEAAGPGAYDDLLIGDIADSGIALPSETFDLAVSWQLLEHVRSLEIAIENIRRSLVPGAHFIAQLSGRRSAIGVANRIIPGRLARLMMSRLLARDPRSVFDAPYDRCTHDDLADILSGWSRFTITPRYRAAAYFGFLPPAQWAYLKYEDWTQRTGRSNLATHYLIDAIR